MSQQSIKKNYIFNVLYQILLIIVPLVVTPYISRVLLADGIGKYSFSFSLITYFTIFASLGFGTYSQREIAKCSDKTNQSIIFWEIIICRFFSVCLSLLVNLILCFIHVYDQYNLYLFIMNINIIAIAFDIAFFFQGNEKFGEIVLLNSITRILGVAAIFIFVRSANDVWKYTLINSIIVLVGYGVLWIRLPKSIVKVPFKSLKPFRHFKGSLLLFLPTIAVSIYTVLDRTLIGLLVPGTVSMNGNIVRRSDLENGYYEQAEKLVKMAMTIITCIGTVMIPRNSKEFASGNLENVKSNIYLSSRFVWLLGIPMVLGLIVVAPFFVPWFYGDGYDKCILLISIFSPLILIIGYSNIFGLQYLIPSGKDKKYTIALIIGALSNLILNLIFIPFWSSVGATIASVIAECFVTITMGIMIRKEISISKIIFMSWRYIVSGFIMFISLFFISRCFSYTMLNTFIIIVIGVAIYFVSLVVLKEPTLMSCFTKIKNKLAK